MGARMEAVHEALWHPCSVCLEKARKSRGLERSLKMTIPEEIYESLQKEMKSIENG